MHPGSSLRSERQGCQGFQGLFATFGMKSSMPAGGNRTVVPSSALLYAAMSTRTTSTPS